ncbi:MAG: tetratricopeptide repeat protein [Myxococcota bacterium]|nr:tetratricopeptide repeat protein [Myxococcota bacterium]
MLRGEARAPRDVDAALRAALLAVLDGDGDEAERLLVAAARLDSDSVETYVALARLLRSRGEVGRAIRIHQNLLLRLDPSSPLGLQALEGLAADFRAGGYQARAIASYEELLTHDSRNERVLRALVELHADAGDSERAIELARRLAKREGKGGAQEAELRTRAAAAAWEAGRSDEARKSVKRALRRDKGCVAAWVLLGELEAERGRNKPALAAWSRVPRLDRASGPLVYAKLEATWAALSDPRKYEAFLRELLEEEPDDVAARLALAHTLAGRGDVDDALSELRDIVDRAPEQVAPRIAIGRLLLEAGRDTEAAKAHADLLDLLDRRALDVGPAREAGGDA